MAGSVRNYRRRILAGEPYPGSLRAFRAFYWTGVVVIFLATLVSGHAKTLTDGRSVLDWVVVGWVVDLAWIVILSSLYCPVDIVWRWRARRRRSRARTGSARPGSST